MKQTHTNDGVPYTHHYRGFHIVFIAKSEDSWRRMVHLFDANNEYRETYNSLAECRYWIDLMKLEKA